jgi:hypothetical protein
MTVRNDGRGGYASYDVAMQEFQMVLDAMLHGGKILHFATIRLDPGAPRMWEWLAQWSDPELPGEHEECHEH